MESGALPLAPLAPTSARAELVGRAKLLARLGIAWHAVEAAVAVGAGIAAGSIALVGFGADSVVESVAGVVLLWRFGGDRHASEAAERTAYRLIGISFYAIAAYVGIEAVRQLVDGSHPEVSWIGIALAAITLATMPPLAIAKGRVAERLGSAATRAEGRQNMLCAYLSGALLIGLGANALAGWWWADPITALVIAAAAVREGRESWRGEGCCTAAIGQAECADDCCD
jgi:divalent metal cation (Fe/Co/Zn/Cd) transporter